MDSKNIILVISLMPVLMSFPCGVVFMMTTITTTSSSTIDDYRVPTDCIASKVINQPGVALKCELQFVNNRLNNANFSAIPSDHTLALDVFCDPATVAPHWQSSFDNVSLAHLKELQELVFVNCDFRELPSSLSSDTLPSTTLTYLAFQRNYVGVDVIGDVGSLEVESGALSKLDLLESLEITSFNVATLPPNELCRLSQLQALNLSLNSLDDVQTLSFSSSSSCGEQLITLDLSFNRLNRITNESFLNLVRLKFLFLQGNVVGELSERAFANLRSLLFLDMSRNRITRFPPDLWLDSDQLLILNASRNAISGTLDAEASFKNLEMLAILDLSHNSIEAISPGTFDRLFDLMELFLASNRIETIADMTFKSLIGLTTLDLSGNKIATLRSSSLSGLRNLTTLLLKDNVVLSTIDEGAFSCCALIANLSLRNNTLTAVPKVQQRGSSTNYLQVLDLSHNQITNIYKDTFSGLFQLTRVDLEDNRIFLVDEASFDDNVDLQRLNLARNRLHIIPDNVLSKNNKLFNLDLSQNYVRYAINFQMNPHLNYLNLSGNQISKLDYGMFPNGLSVLDISRNRLTFVDEKFAAARKVRITYLDASHNHLQSVTPAMLPNTVKLLLLNNNNVSYIQGGTFADMADLLFVDLSHNTLASMRMDALQVKVTPTLRRPLFFFQGNAFVCDCTMKWFKTINVDNVSSRDKLYGVVYDLSSLFCWTTKFYDGTGGDRAISLIARTADDKFLCAFQEQTFSDAICYRKIPQRTICTVVCPDGCRCYHDSIWSVVIVRCTSYVINVTRIPSNIPAMVSSLYLDGNMIKQLSTSYSSSFDDLPVLKHLYLNDTGLKSLDAEAFVKLPALEELHLERNSLRELKNGTFHGLDVLTFLDLSSNALDSLEAGVFGPLRSLEVLRLNDNYLISFPIWTLTEAMPKLSAISLSDNPWKCDCDYLDSYREWLQDHAHIVTDPDKLFCSPTEKNMSSPIPMIAFNASYCFNASVTNLWKLENKGEKYVPLLAGLLSTFLTISLAIVLIYAYRKEMQVLVYSRTGVRLFQWKKEDEDDQRPEKVFDAFVSYSSLDENFVVQDLLPKLEGTAGPTYKLCLHHRNFLAGGFIMDSIMEAIEKSRRTILILSDNFMSSEWCRFEFKSAHLQMLKDRRSRVILVILGKIPDQLDPEMKLYMKTNTYLTWGDRLFWQKMYFALPEVRKPEA